MRRTLAFKILIVFILPWGLVAKAHTDEQGQRDCANCPNGAFSCQTVFDTSMSIDQVRKLIEKMYGPQVKEISSRKDLSTGDRLVLKRWADASLNWFKLKALADEQLNSKYDQRMKQVIQSALTNHFHGVWTKEIKNPDDMTRHYEILGEIAALKPDNLEYGFFRIQRLIQARYDLEQYANCR